MSEEEEESIHDNADLSNNEEEEAPTESEIKTYSSTGAGIGT
jgi:hypothetical protein